MGRWRAAVESSESALQLLPEHAKSRSRQQRALAGEMRSRLQDSAPGPAPEAIGSEAEIRRAADTLSKLLLPSLFDGGSRLQGLYSGGDSPTTHVTRSVVVMMLLFIILFFFRNKRTWRYNTLRTVEAYYSSKRIDRPAICFD